MMAEWRVEGSRRLDETPAAGLGWHEAAGACDIFYVPRNVGRLLIENLCIPVRYSICEECLPPPVNITDDDKEGRT